MLPGIVQTRANRSLAHFGGILVRRLGPDAPSCPGAGAAGKPGGTIRSHTLALSTFSDICGSQFGENYHRLAHVTQTDTIEFLSSGRAFSDGRPAEVIETHGAYIFLGSETALKLKRAVSYDYMDLGSVAQRKKMLLRELELNKPAAPEIYRDVLPVTRKQAGLELGGDGPVVDWVLRMWRFPQMNELDRIAQRGALDDRLATAMGTSIAKYHTAAPVIYRSGRTLIADILDELKRVFAEYPEAAGTSGLAAWQRVVRDHLRETGALLDARSAAGHVRRVHGDLHLRNMVLIDGRPVLFDALEFDETLGTCDVLYDIAFLVMDLCHRGLDRQACRTLEAWLRAAHGAEDRGLAALPIFLSVRAAIRAMVLLQTDAARARPGASASEIAAYLELASAALTPKAPVLLAIGGYSGSGKSVLSQALTAQLGAMPGAVLLSSDLERKAGLPLQAKLDPSSYDVENRHAVYDAILNRAEAILASGHSVLLDATFLDPDLRGRAEAVATRSDAAFLGLWLDAPVAVLKDRVRSRRGDASDADVSVLELQLAQDRGEMRWHLLDASGTPEATRAMGVNMCQEWLHR